MGQSAFGNSCNSPQPASASLPPFPPAAPTLNASALLLFGASHQRLNTAYSGISSDVEELFRSGVVCLRIAWTWFLAVLAITSCVQVLGVVGLEEDVLSVENVG